MRMEFREAKLDSKRKKKLYLVIIKTARLSSAQTTSTGAAATTLRQTEQPDIKNLADPARALAERQSSDYKPKDYNKSGPTY